MQKLTRRRLIKQASIGAGAASMLAVTVSTKAHHADKASTLSTKAALASGEALVVYVTDVEAGTLTVLRGEQVTIVNNVALVHHLLSL